jgi:hypothetical protein
MSTTGQAPARGPTKRFFLIEVWEENRNVVKVIVGDALLFAIVLGVLLLAHKLLHSLEDAGYPRDRIAVMDQVHFYAYFVVDLLLAIDLIQKLVVFLFFPRKGGST